MIDTSNKTQCCGCTACFSVCPKSAITMQPDEEGFLYPVVNTADCVDCGLCEKVCPVENRPMVHTKDNKSYVVRVKQHDVLMQSTSGGFVTPLAKWIMEQDGVFIAATYDENFRVIHAVATKETLPLFRGSKYVQSDMGDCYQTIKECLDRNQYVCFVGTPCQVNGLCSFLGKPYDALVTVDLVCHGVPSPKLWEKYLDYQKNKYDSDISDIAFRNKTYGYHSGTMKIRFKNGKIYYGSARVDCMLKSFFSEISSRPICYQCPFKTLERCSDFTIYDCWHASDLIDQLQDDDCGYTNVLVQSQKGQSILEQLKSEYEIYPVDTDRAVMLDGSMVLQSATPHPKREEYCGGLSDASLTEHVQRFIPIKKKDYLIEKSKRFLYGLGVIDWARKLKKKNSVPIQKTSDSKRR